MDAQGRHRRAEAVDVYANIERPHNNFRGIGGLPFIIDPPISFEVVDKAIQKVYQSINTRTAGINVSMMYISSTAKEDEEAVLQRVRKLSWAQPLWLGTSTCATGRGIS